MRTYSNHIIVKMHYDSLIKHQLLPIGDPRDPRTIDFPSPGRLGSSSSAV